MLSRSVTRLSSDFAHKQVSSGFSKKYGENFDRIFGKKPSSQGTSGIKNPDVSKDAKDKIKSK